MGKNLWKLVRLSARGRRRENRALFLVLSFLFFLVAAGIVWFSISRYTRQEQKYDAFGEWKAAFYGGTEEQIRKFTENPATVRSGISRVGGSILSPDWEARMEELDRQFEWEMEETARACREAGIEFEMLPLDQYTLEEKIRTVLYLPPEEPVSLTDYFGEAGFIGTLDQGTAELGRIRMSQGRLPREDGEIALTEELLSSLGLEGKLGETVTLRVVGGENQMEVIRATIEKCQSSSMLLNYQQVMESIAGTFESNIEQERIAQLVSAQLFEKTDWNIVSYSVSGSGSRQTTYSMPGRSVYVMIPDESTVEHAKELLQKIQAGEILVQE